jgi:hypothetical protein
MLLTLRGGPAKLFDLRESRVAASMPARAELLIAVFTTRAESLLQYAPAAELLIALGDIRSLSLLRVNSPIA